MVAAYKSAYLHSVETEIISLDASKISLNETKNSINKVSKPSQENDLQVIWWEFIQQPLQLYC